MSVKNEFIDLTLDDDDTSTSDYSPSVRAEEMATTWNNSRLDKGKEKVIEFKGKEFEKPQKQQSADSKPKKFIKATKSYLLNGFMADNLDDTTAYSWDTTTYTEQAAKEPNFIGNAFYYNLGKTSLYPDLGGEYVILYTRPVGTRFDQQAQSTTFPPCMGTRIIIATEVPKGNSDMVKNIERILRAGYWAAGDLSFNGLHVAMRCEKVSNSPHNFNRHKASVKTHPTDTTSTNADVGALDHMLEYGLRDTGSTISFGIKVTKGLWNEEQFKTDFFGFHFLQLELACFNARTKKPDRQLIVAVKIPKASDGDVSSMFILKQRLLSVRDVSILESKERVRELAHWHTYAVTEKYQARKTPSGWTPDATTDMGLDGGSFDASELEYHLFHCRDPIRELSNLIVWLGNFTIGPSTSKQDSALCEAREYMENRLQGMRFELRLREEAGGLGGPWPVPYSSHAVPTQGKQGSWKMENMEKSEKPMPLGDKKTQSRGGGVSLSIPRTEWEYDDAMEL